MEKNHFTQLRFQLVLQMLRYSYFWIKPENLPINCKKRKKEKEKKTDALEIQEFYLN